MGREEFGEIKSSVRYLAQSAANMMEDIPFYCLWWERRCEVSWIIRQDFTSSRCASVLAGMEQWPEHWRQAISMVSGNISASMTGRPQLQMIRSCSARS